MRNKVRWADEIDVVTALALEFDHDAAEVIEGNLIPLSLTADRVILAEDASKIAVGHKNRSRPMAANERSLLPKMGPIGGNDWKIPGPAEAFLSSGPIQAALSRANRAPLEQSKGLVNPSWEKPFLVSTEISRFEIPSAHDLSPALSLFLTRDLPPSPGHLLTINILADPSTGVKCFCCGMKKKVENRKHL